MAFPISIMRKKQKVLLILDRLAEVISSPETELEYISPFHLLIAVILSAQCTDKRVNMTTPALFERFPSPSSLADSNFDEVFSYIKSISFPANKTRHLLKTAQIISEDFRGQIPRNYDDLLRLPGVGRKTANVVSSILWNEPRLAVDTHVFRVGNRLGLTQAKTPAQSENQLTALIPEDRIPDAHQYLILHGRYTCVARKPKCDICPLTDLCLWFRKNQN